MVRTPRGKDNQKRKKRSRRKPCPYKIVSVYDHLSWHGEEDGFRPHALSVATKYRPGSLEKIDVMCKRVSAGQMLFNKNDFDGD